MPSTPIRSPRRSRSITPRRKRFRSPSQKLFDETVPPIWLPPSAARCVMCGNLEDICNCDPVVCAKIKQLRIIALNKVSKSTVFAKNQQRREQTRLLGTEEEERRRILLAETRESEHLFCVVAMHSTAEATLRMAESAHRNERLIRWQQDSQRLYNQHQTFVLLLSLEEAERTARCLIAKACREESRLLVEIKWGIHSLERAITLEMDERETINREEFAEKRQLKEAMDRAASWMTEAGRIRVRYIQDEAIKREDILRNEQAEVLHFRAMMIETLDRSSAESRQRDALEWDEVRSRSDLVRYEASDCVTLQREFSQAILHYRDLEEQKRYAISLLEAAEQRDRSLSIEAEEREQFRVLRELRLKALADVDALRRRKAEQRDVLCAQAINDVSSIFLDQDKERMTTEQNIQNMLRTLEMVQRDVIELERKAMSKTEAIFHEEQQARAVLSIEARAFQARAQAQTNLRHRLLQCSQDEQHARNDIVKAHEQSLVEIQSLMSAHAQGVQAMLALAQLDATRSQESAEVHARHLLEAAEVTERRILLVQFTAELSAIEHLKTKHTEEREAVASASDSSLMLLFADEASERASLASALLQGSAALRANSLRRDIRTLCAEETASRRSLTEQYAQETLSLSLMEAQARVDVTEEMAAAVLEKKLAILNTEARFRMEFTQEERREWTAILQQWSHQHSLIVQKENARKLLPGLMGVSIFGGEDSPHHGKRPRSDSSPGRWSTARWSGLLLPDDDDVTLKRPLVEEALKGSSLHDVSPSVISFLFNVIDFTTNLRNDVNISHEKAKREVALLEQKLPMTKDQLSQKRNRLGEFIARTSTQQKQFVQQHTTEKKRLDAEVNKRRQKEILLDDTSKEFDQLHSQVGKLRNNIHTTLRRFG